MNLTPAVVRRLPALVCDAVITVQASGAAMSAERAAFRIFLAEEFGPEAAYAEASAVVRECGRDPRIFLDPPDSYQ